MTAREETLTAALALIDRVLAGGSRTAALWVRLDDGPAEAVGLFDRHWRPALRAQRAELAAALRRGDDGDGG